MVTCLNLNQPCSLSHQRTKQSSPLKNEQSLLLSQTHGTSQLWTISSRPLKLYRRPFFSFTGTQDPSPFICEQSLPFNLFYFVFHFLRSVLWMFGRILQLPVLSASSRDRLVWKANQPKLFTVISTYQVALRLKHQARIEHSGVRAHRVVRKNVWAFNVTYQACWGNTKGL